MHLKHIIISLLVGSCSLSASAVEKKRICTWDPVGKNGPVMEFYKDLKPKTIAWA